MKRAGKNTLGDISSMTIDELKNIKGINESSIIEINNNQQNDSDTLDELKASHCGCFLLCTKSYITFAPLPNLSA